MFLQFTPCPIGPKAPGPCQYENTAYTTWQLHLDSSRNETMRPRKDVEKEWSAALLNPFLSVVIKQKRNVRNVEERNQKKSQPKCLSKGRPNVNLLTFASAKHKPTTKCVVQWMSYYKRGFSFHTIRSVLDGSLLCYFDLNSQVFSMIRKPCNTNSLGFRATHLQQAAMQEPGDLKTLAKFASYITLSVCYWQAAFSESVANGRLTTILNKSHTDDTHD